MRVAPIALFLLMSGCSTCTPPATGPTTEDNRSTGERPSAEEAAEIPEQSDEAEGTADDPAPVRPSRPTTARERVERLQSLPADERTRLRRRTELLGEGRRLAHDGDHAASLAAFEAALRLAPHDVTVMCETGNQARLLERYEAAAAHLEIAIERAAPPRSMAMCLYNLGRVREEQERPYDAYRHYSRSLELRPNRIVEGRLDALDVEIDELERREDEELEAREREGFDLSRLEGRHFRTLDALANEAGCGHDSWSDDSSRVPEVPTPSAELREVGVYLCADELNDEFKDLLCVRSDAGWALVEAVAQSDLGDTFGRLEATETTTVRFDGSDLIVLVDGGFDEREGEAVAYWDCEDRYPDDVDAVSICFDEATLEMDPPETWTAATRYRFEDGAWVGTPIEDPAPYFEALTAGE